jgi:predicted trehalose synthase
MCSITGDGTDELGRLGQAIDDLADAVAAQQDPRAGQAARAASPELSLQELAARLAAIWQMVAELDPELSRRLSEYGR